MSTEVEATSAGGRLRGCCVVVTRERPGELGALLAEEGAEVVHVPLIEVVDPIDGGRELASRLDHIGDHDWLIVTSPAGAERVAPAARRHPDVKVAVVGTATGRRFAELAGRPADLMPERQLAVELAAGFCERNPTPRRVLLALADRAGSELADVLRAHGHSVVEVTAYRTLERAPSPRELAGAADADAIVFASGSAAESWANALGSSLADATPSLVVVIGPTTASVASASGLKVDGVAADHSVPGLVDELARQWQNRHAS